jgi:hypothetical protein
VIIGYSSEIAPGPGTTSLIIGVPAGTLDGDLLIWIIGDTASAGIINNTPTGWVFVARGVGGGGAALAIYKRVASGDTGGSYTATGTLYPTHAMIALWGAASIDETVFANDTNTAIHTPALSGLSTSLDLAIGAYCYGATFDPTVPPAFGVFTSFVDAFTPSPGFPAQRVGFWVGHANLLATSLAQQNTSNPQSVNWQSATIAVRG